jgi:hypothetical protein
VVTEAKTSIELKNDEILVLFEFLHRIGEDRQVAFHDQAEQRVLWDLLASLEAAIPQLFSADYAEQLQEARERLRDATD